MTREQYIKNTLELNLFYSRLFKEHCIILAAAQRNGDMRFLQSLDRYKVRLEMLLNAAIESGLSLIDARYIERDCFVTPYTYSLEISSQNACGVSINHRITNLEIERLSKPQPIPAGRLPVVYERALRINADGQEISQGLAELVENILNEILRGRIYSCVYPSVYESIGLEIKRYQKALEALKQDKNIDFFDSDAVKIMQTNAQFIRGGLDPKESQDFEKANNFAQEFSKCGSDKESFLKVNAEFSQFTQDLIERLMAKKLISAILPIALDNILRQANRNMVILQSRQ
ncbi:MAG TPA: DUF2935 domain-containing protein [Clostridia bacterium]